MELYVIKKEIGNHHHILHPILPSYTASSHPLSPTHSPSTPTAPGPSSTPRTTAHTRPPLFTSASLHQNSTHIRLSPANSYRSNPPPLTPASLFEIEFFVWPPHTILTLHTLRLLLSRFGCGQLQISFFSLEAIAPMGFAAVACRRFQTSSNNSSGLDQGIRGLFG